MTEKEFQKKFDERFSQLVKSSPADFAMAMLVKMAEMCVEANAATMDLKQQSTIEGKRYQVKCKISIKEINQP